MAFGENCMWDCCSIRYGFALFCHIPGSRGLFLCRFRGKSGYVTCATTESRFYLDIRLVRKQFRSLKALCEQEAFDGRRFSSVNFIMNQGNMKKKMAFVYCYQMYPFIYCIKCHATAGQTAYCSSVIISFFIFPPFTACWRFFLCNL